MSAIKYGRKDFLVRLLARYESKTKILHLGIYAGLEGLMHTPDFGCERDLQIVDLIFERYAEDSAFARRVESYFTDREMFRNARSLQIIAKKIPKLKKFNRRRAVFLVSQESEMAPESAAKMKQIIDSIPL